jgi:SAM-dependent methyltransferase
MRKLKSKNPPSSFIDYGLDVPWVIGAFFSGGLLLCGLALLMSHQPLQRFAALLLSVLFLAAGFLFLALGFWLFWSSVKGKRLSCRRLAAGFHLKGNERLLDVGCGRGLVLIEAARKLDRGRAVGLDNWSQPYLFKNSRERTLSNARAVGVEERVEVVTGDMRRLPFSPGRFDIVVANLALHRVRPREGRRKALKEMVRVLKKGGQLVLQDFLYAHQYQEDLEGLGLKEMQVSALSFLVFPPVRMMRVVKK